jgi:hypothetical protein
MLPAADAVGRDISAASAAAPLTGRDRLVMRPERFGAMYDGEAGWPCETERLYELRDPLHTGRFAYLAACRDADAVADAARPRPVALDAGANTIRSPLFEYVFLPNNQLIFASLKVREGAGGPLRPAAGDADLLLHLDVRNFFSLDLTNKNVQSFVESTHAGELGFVGRLQFYLRLLFFKIDLKMAATANFYADAANIPMLVDVPVDAPRRLHPGSGMLFNFREREARLDLTHPLSNIKAADPAAIKKGYAALGAAAAAACRGRVCPYRLVGRLGSQSFVIDMAVPRFMVARGFYPQWVPHVGRFAAALDWDEPEDAVAANAGMYYETSGLPKGRYQVDYWIRMAADEVALQGRCPTTVALGRLLTPPTTATDQTVKAGMAPTH